MRGKITLGLLLGCLAALLLTGCGGAQSRFSAHMKRGQEYFDHGDYAKASVEFRNATQIQPEAIEPRLMEARGLERLDKPRQALGVYQFVIDKAPGNTEAISSFGRILVTMGAAADAMKVIGPAATKHPEDPKLLTVRAAAKSQLDDQAGAVADIEHALRLAPTDEQAIQVRAGLYKRAGDLPGAVKFVDEAIHRSPGSTQLRQMLVDLYVSSGEPAKAQQQLK